MRHAPDSVLLLLLCGRRLSKQASQMWCESRWSDFSLSLGQETRCQPTQGQKPSRAARNREPTCAKALRFCNCSPAPGRPYKREGREGRAARQICAAGPPKLLGPPPSHKKPTGLAAQTGSRPQPETMSKSRPGQDQVEIMTRSRLDGGQDVVVDVLGEDGLGEGALAVRRLDQLAVLDDDERGEAVDLGVRGGGGGGRCVCRGWVRRGDSGRGASQKTKTGGLFVWGWGGGSDVWAAITQSCFLPPAPCTWR
jgi:hypothetical protein